MLSYRTGKAVPAILRSTIDLASLIASAPGPRGSYFDTIGSKLKLQKRTEEAPMRRTGSPVCRLGARPGHLFADSARRTDCVQKPKRPHRG